jgi:hypothetical protein
MSLLVLLVHRLVNEVDAEEREDVGLQQGDEGLDDVDEDRQSNARQSRQIGCDLATLHLGKQEYQADRSGDDKVARKHVGEQANRQRNGLDD